MSLNTLLVAFYCFLLYDDVSKGLMLTKIP